MSDIEDHYPDFWLEDDESGSTELLTLHFENVKAETKRAWLIDFGMKEDSLDDVEHWLPKSQCSLNRAKKQIQVPEWLAIEKEIESYEV